MSYLTIITDVYLMISSYSSLIFDFQNVNLDINLPETPPDA